MKVPFATASGASPQPFILATAGHVDHGKSALVKALTGTDPDRLPEEKARGITIDLGFAHLELPAPGEPPDAPPRFSCGIIDVPGHEDFIRNMVAGVGSIDAALLVVAADDGWMPQTEEHLQILAYLGVRRAVVAVTKIDLVPPPDPVLRATRVRLADTPFADAPIVPVSVVDGHGNGLDALRSALSSVLARTPPPPAIGKPRLAIDRVFVLRGIGTVITGTLAGGFLRRGDEVVVQPGARATRIRSCQSHGREIESAAPGMRLALNLPDLSSVDTDPIHGLRRGDVVMLPGTAEGAARLDVRLEKSPRLLGTQSLAARPLRSGTTVWCHLGSAHVRARVILLPGPELAPGNVALAQLRLERPLPAFVGDHFILRDSTHRATLAGGRVLDLPPARARRAETIASLSLCAAQPDRPDPFLLHLLRRDGPTPAGRLLQASRFAPRDLAAALGRLAAAGDVLLAGALAAWAPAWNAALDRIAQSVDAFHRTRNDAPGLPLAQVRADLERSTGWTVGWESILAALEPRGFVADGTFLRRRDHRPPLPPGLEAAASRLRHELLLHPFDPPSRAQLAPDPTSQKALQCLVQSGEVLELALDVVLATTAFQRARERILEHLRRHTQATAGQLRELLGTQRRIIIPLLEKLDRDGWTRREGDLRRVFPRSSPTPPASPPVPPA